jgi:guanylate kinase
MSKPLICILGVSGSGKTSLVNKVNKKYGYEVLKSYTTRPVRENDDSDLSSHIFVTQTEADLIANKDKIVASNIFADHFYFATRRQLQNADLYVTDVVGLKDVYRKFIDKPILSIFLDVPPEIVAERMSRRGDDDEDIMRRLQHDQQAFDGAKEYCDFVCDNSTQEQCNDIVDFIDMLFKYYKG